MLRYSKQGKLFGTFVKAMILGVATAMVASAAGEEISIAGATTMKPLLEDAAKAFGKSHADVRIVVGVGGSARGIELAGKGEVRLGTTCRDPGDKEKAQYSDLVVQKIGLDANAILVHATNPVQKITAAEVAKIYAGKTTNWKDLGGKDAPIVLLSVSAKHSSYEVLLDYFKLEGKSEAGGTVFKLKTGGDFSGISALTVDTTQQVLAEMITKPNAIACASLGAALALADKGAPIKALELDGVAATIGNVQAGSYPLPRPLLLVSKGQPTGTVKEFVEFLMGNEGRQILKAKGFIEVK